MYLYDKKDEKIDVYLLDLNKDRAYDYKKMCMEMIPEDSRMLKATGREYYAFNHTKEYIFNGHSNKNVVFLPEDKLERRFGLFTQGYHHIGHYDYVGYERIRQTEFLEDYFRGIVSGMNMVVVSKDKRIKSLENLKYFLLTSDYYYKYDQESTMHNIISIPRELFLLEWCLFGGSLDCLNDYEFDTIIKLFDIDDKPMDTFTIEDIIRFRNYGLVDVTNKSLIAMIDNQVEASQNTLRRIRSK